MNAGRVPALLSILLAGSVAAAAEVELNEAAAAGVLRQLAAEFARHPAVRARMSVKVTDLLGERTEEGWMAIARPVRILRQFEKPSKKSWFLDGSRLDEYIPERRETLRKDFSGAPKILHLLQAGMSGDFAALQDVFALKVFTDGTDGKPPSWRVELTKKSGAPKLLHKVISARIRPEQPFFDEIRYVPEQGDEIVETFSDFKDLSGPQAPEFSLPAEAAANITTTKISE